MIYIRLPKEWVRAIEVAAKARGVHESEVLQDMLMNGTSIKELLIINAM